jgi:hypothetical protein
MAMAVCVACEMKTCLLFSRFFALLPLKARARHRDGKLDQRANDNGSNCPGSAKTLSGSIAAAHFIFSRKMRHNIDAWENHNVMGCLEYGRAFPVFLLVAFSLLSPVVSTARDRVEIRNFPEKELCVATKSAVDSMERDKYGVAIRALPSRMKRNPDESEISALPLRSYSTADSLQEEKNFTVKNLIFYADKASSIEFIRDGIKRKMMEKYYLIDIDNDGSLDLIEALNGSIAGFGVLWLGDSIAIYEKVWIFEDRPVLFDSMNIKKEIHAFNREFSFPSIRDEYFIAPFHFAQKNYLLFERNGVYRKNADFIFWVGELLPDGKLITHCHF